MLSCHKLTDRIVCLSVPHRVTLKTICYLKTLGENLKSLGEEQSMNRLVNTACLVAMTVHNSGNSVSRQRTETANQQLHQMHEPREGKGKTRTKVTVAARISKTPRQIKITVLGAPDE